MSTETKTGIVYLLYNTVNYKLYVGSSKRKLTLRISDHKCKAKDHKSRLYRHMRKIGSDNFLIKEICRVPESELLKTEDFYIKIFGIGTKMSLNKRRAGWDNKEWSKYHKISPKEYHAEYYKDNKSKFQEKSKEYYIKNRDREIARVRQYEKDNKEHIKSRKKIYREKHKEEIKAYYHENKEHLAKKKREKRASNRARGLFYCESCNYTAPTKFKLETHYKTSKHERVLKIVAGEITVKYSCVPCAYYNNSKQAYNAHMIQKRHLAKVSS